MAASSISTACDTLFGLSCGDQDKAHAFTPESDRRIQLELSAESVTGRARQGVVLNLKPCFQQEQGDVYNLSSEKVALLRSCLLNTVLRGSTPKYWRKQPYPGATDEPTFLCSMRNTGDSASSAAHTKEDKALIFECDAITTELDKQLQSMLCISDLQVRAVRYIESGAGRLLDWHADGTAASFVDGGFIGFTLLTRLDGSKQGPMLEINQGTPAPVGQNGCIAFSHRLLHRSYNNKINIDVD